MLRRSAGEVDLDGIARNRHGRSELDVALECLEDVVRFVASVWEGGDAGAHAALRVRVELVHRRHDAVVPTPRAELGDTLLREPVRGELGSQVAAALFGVPHLRHERRDHLVVEPGRRDHDALFGQRARIGGHRAGLAAAHVGVVRTRDREADFRT